MSWTHVYPVMSPRHLRASLSRISACIRHETYPHTRDGLYRWLQSNADGMSVLVAEVDHFRESTKYLFSVVSRSRPDKCLLSVEGWGCGSSLELCPDSICQSEAPFSLESPSLTSVTQVAGDLSPLSLAMESVGFHLMLDHFSLEDARRIVWDCTAGDYRVAGVSSHRDGTVTLDVVTAGRSEPVAYIDCSPVEGTRCYSLQGIGIITR